MGLSCFDNIITSKPILMSSSQARDRDIEGVTSQTMLEFLPCSDQTRLKLVELMSGHKGKIFTDPYVHMLMVCLILFDSQDVDKSIR